SANGCGSDADTSTPICGNFSGCCARAASGQAVAPPSSVMKSRRFMEPSIEGAAECWAAYGNPSQDLFGSTLCQPKAPGCQLLEAATSVGCRFLGSSQASSALDRVRTLR